jgi:hypothetical protein
MLSPRGKEMSVSNTFKKQAIKSHPHPTKNSPNIKSLFDFFGEKVEFGAKKNYNIL